MNRVALGSVGSTALRQLHHVLFHTELCASQIQGIVPPQNRGQKSGHDPGRLAVWRGGEIVHDSKVGQAMRVRDD